MYAEIFNGQNYSSWWAQSWLCRCDLSQNDSNLDKEQMAGLDTLGLPVTVKETLQVLLQSKLWCRSIITVVLKIVFCLWMCCQIFWIVYSLFSFSMWHGIVFCNQWFLTNVFLIVRHHVYCFHVFPATNLQSFSVARICCLFPDQWSLTNVFSLSDIKLM